jgi:type II secretory pathway component GspD/PulD (secretin)
VLRSAELVYDTRLSAGSIAENFRRNCELCSVLDMPMKNVLLAFAIGGLCPGLALAGANSIADDGVSSTFAQTNKTLTNYVLFDGIILDRRSTLARKFGKPRSKQDAVEILENLQTQNALLNPDTRSQTNLALVGTNGFTSVTCLSVNLDLAASALTNLGDFKVVSKPRIVTPNGTAAMIFIGDTVPYVHAGYFNSGKPRWKPQRGTGVSLKLTPTLDAEARLTVRLHQTLEETSTDETARVQTLRSAETNTEITSHHGQMIVLSGCVMTFGSKRSRELLFLIRPSLVIEGRD